MEQKDNKLLYSVFVIIVTGITIFFVGINELHDRRHFVHYLLAILWGVVLLVTLSVDKYKEKGKRNKVHIFIDACAIYFILFHLVYSFHIQHGSKSIYDFF
jgi:hypothetical protein